MLVLKTKMFRFAVKNVSVWLLWTAYTLKSLANNYVKVENMTSFWWNFGKNDVIVRVLLFDFYTSQGLDKGV